MKSLNMSSLHFCAMFIFVIGMFPNGKIGVRLKAPLKKYDFNLDANLSLVPANNDYLEGFSDLHSNEVYKNQSGVIIADSPTHRVHSRKRRSVLQLASMLKCVTGCSPLAFHGYGCFCGYMGDGSPVDPIDSCCLEHDWCYSATQCSHVATYFLPYHWQCSGSGYAYCGLSDSASPHAQCGQQLCECDVEFAKCISKYPCPSHRAGCRQGRSLFRRLFSDHSFHISMQSDDSSARKVIHEVLDYIVDDAEEDEPYIFKVKKKSKTKVTLTAGLHKDPFSNLPGVHVNAEVDHVELGKKVNEDEKLPKGDVVIEEHHHLIDERADSDDKHDENGHHIEEQHGGGENALKKKSGKLLQPKKIKSKKDEKQLKSSALQHVAVNVTTTTSTPKYSIDVLPTGSTRAPSRWYARLYRGLSSIHNGTSTNRILNYIFGNARDASDKVQNRWVINNSESIHQT